MKIERYFTHAAYAASSSPIEWKTIEVGIDDAATGASVLAKRTIEVPTRWSDNAATIFAHKYLRKAGVPIDTRNLEINGDAMMPVWNGEDAPAWLRPRVPTTNATFGGETSARQVFHRLAGDWAYRAWMTGTIKTNAGIAAFYDELYWMLANQLAAPNSPQWFNTGLWWAYGIAGPASGAWVCDDGTPRPAADSYSRPQPHACFIQPIDDSLVGEGGIFDLLHREARLFKYGSGTGTNFSTLRGKGEPLAGGGTSSGLMSFLRVFDAGAGATKSGGTTRRAAKMVVLDLDHPEIEAFVDWKAREESKAAAMYVGSQVLRNYYLGNGDARNDPYVHVPQATIDRMDEGFEPEIFGVSWEGEALASVSGQNSNNSIRVTNEFLRCVDFDAYWNLVSRTDGKIVKEVPAKDLWNRICRAAWASADPGVQFHDTMNEWHTCANDGPINASNPCSEYLFLDDTACNLASLNLVKFDAAVDGPFDYAGFEHAVRLWTIVLELSVSMASFPSKEIAWGSWAYRTLGLGYANVAGLLMRRGIPYDSDEGRALIAAITALMTGVAYRTSAELADELGPFPRWEANADSMRRVLRNHAVACHSYPIGKITREPAYESLSVNPPTLRATLIDSELCERIRVAWESVIKAKAFRNAQTTLIAPTGTIGLIMDCDVPGIEPFFSLATKKDLAGGGTMYFFNEAPVRAAGRAIGLSPPEIDRVIEQVRKTGSVKGSPVSSFNDDYVSIFDTAVPAVPGGRFLDAMAHVRMVAAVQPFLSGGVSKTVNLPPSATVADVDRVYREAHRLGVKAVALYRDGCKLNQPLSVAGRGSTKIDPRSNNAERSTETITKAPTDGKPVERTDEVGPLDRGVREYLPWRRERGWTQKVKIGDAGLSVFLRIGEYPDGRPGEMFLELAHEGSTLRAFANLFAIAVSVGLQHGVPVDEYVDRFLHAKFEPAGLVEGHEKIKMVTSIADYVARELALTYLGREDLADRRAVPEPRVAVVPKSTDAAAPSNVSSGASPAPVGALKPFAMPVAVVPSVLVRAGAEVVLTGDFCPECHSIDLYWDGTCKRCRSCGTGQGACGG